MKAPRYLRQATVVGDGAKYILLDGKYVPWVSSSRTGRLREHDIAEWLVVEHGYVDFYERHPRYLPHGAEWEDIK